VHGTIRSVTAITAPEDGKTYPATAIDLDVKEALKGAWNKSTIRTVLLGTAELGAVGVTYDYSVGEEVILCLRFDPAQGGMFRFWGDGQSFVKRGDQWVDRRGRQVDEKLIREVSKQSTPSAMTNSADVVFVGNVLAVEARDFDCGLPKPCMADYAHVRVIEPLKGAATGETVLVRVLRRGSQLGWYEPVPELHIGAQYMMFLKKDETGLYPYAGFNGMLEVRDDTLILNDHLPYYQSKTAVLKTVKEVSGE